MCSELSYDSKWVEVEGLQPDIRLTGAKKPVGKLLSRQGNIALAHLRLEYAESKDLYLTSESGNQVYIKPFIPNPAWKTATEENVAGNKG